MKEGKPKNVIQKVAEGSIADELGIEVGDTLISINGSLIEDIIEYKFHLSDEYLEVEIEKPNGEIWTLEIEKDYDEDLGIDFDNPILAHMRSCHNKCIFCFIDQLPKNMRESLYFKDDDSRLSFLHGNYITLTNMKKKDIDKIIKYRISPINISVHTTNPQLRIQMLNNKNACNILQLLKRLADHEIAMNCQIVLCPNINDGKELDNTLADLGKLTDAIISVAVVPVGLTGHRENLMRLEGYDSISSNKVIQQVEEWQKKFLKKLNRNFVYLSDEFYVLANVAIPPYKSYDGFPQLENGVGMMAKFEFEVKEALKTKFKEVCLHKKITVVTGRLAYAFMKRICEEIMNKVKNVTLDIVCVHNDFFGGQVSVSGLLTGKDIAYSLQQHSLGDKVIIAENMLKSGEDVFLDDMTVLQLQSIINTPIVVIPVEGEKLVEVIIN